ncbi:MAG: glucokinase [Pseudomonadota bacterium]
MSDLVLVADIGGTNTRVALARDGSVEPSSVRRFANAEASGLDEVLTRYLSETETLRERLSGACAAGAGPVTDGEVRLTNLDWRIGPALLRDVAGTDRVAVLNDLQAQGHGIGHGDQNQIHTVAQPGTAPDARGTKLVVGVGTGFNAAPVYETGSGRLVVPSEAGHVSLPDAGGASGRVIEHLQNEFGFAAVEEALSGRGIGHVHEALHGESKSAQEVMAALDADDSRAQATVRTVVSLLGAVVGDLALLTLPRGGIFLVGGVCRNLWPWLEPYGFAHAMHAKGRFKPFVQDFAVHLVTDDFAALTGCAAYLAEAG